MYPSLGDAMELLPSEADAAEWSLQQAGKASRL